MKRGRNAGTGRFDAVLFDLDGTLVDTAPDMVSVLLKMQESRGQQPADYDVVRNNVSNGAIGLLRIGFPDASDDMLGELHKEYLDGYQQHLCINSSIFSPLDSLLDEFDDQHIPWGVVTNKPEAMTIPLLDALKIRRSAACIVSGDTLPERKPNPAPLLS